MSRVSKVTVTVTFDNGTVVDMSVGNPQPSGDNPTFIGTQISHALGQLEDRMLAVAGVEFGPQVRLSKS